MMVVSPAICGTVIARYGTEEQKQQLAARHLRRHRHDGLRDHRARRRHQLPQHHHDCPPRRRRVGAQGPEDLHLRRRRGRPTCSSSRGPRTRGRASSSPASSWSRPTRRASSTPRSRWRSSAPRSSSRSSSTTSGCPRDALVGDEDGGLVQLFAGLNPERIMAASFSTGLARHALEKRVVVRQGADRVPGARSAPTRPSPTRSRWPTSRTSWPG